MNQVEVDLDLKLGLFLHLLIGDSYNQETLISGDYSIITLIFLHFDNLKSLAGSILLCHNGISLRIDHNDFSISFYSHCVYRISSILYE